jgi:hypothetical protein
MSKIPCENCICLPICKDSKQGPYRLSKATTIGPFITHLGHKCSLLSDYILLKDLNLEMPLLNTPIGDRKYFTIPQSQRIIELFKFMNWEDKCDLSTYYREAQL